MKTAIIYYSKHGTTIPKAMLGGEFQFDKMNFIERFLTKKIAKVTSSVPRLRYDAIREFAAKVKQ